MVLASLGRSAGRLLSAGSGAVGRRHAGGGVHIQPRYRQFPELTRAQVIRSEFLSGFMWFWILWHFWHSSDMVLVRPARRRGPGGGGPWLWPGSEPASLPGTLPLPRPFGLDGRGAGDPSGRRGIGGSSGGALGPRSTPVRLLSHRPPGAAAGPGFAVRSDERGHQANRSPACALPFLPSSRCQGIAPDGARWAPSLGTATGTLLTEVICALLKVDVPKLCCTECR
uniref:NADH dehydrogenase [ubiquinone] 1 beta subcomplex subunit 2, mitochondrial n=1 Tax=Melopsittacus undulatus TaxID=13146 RepID=A0A8C6NDE6_MELUD